MAFLFGTHLVERGLISADNLVAAMEEQVRQKPPIGRLALREGVLLVEQVWEILSLQADHWLKEPPPHRRFGEIATSLGYLAPSDVTRLMDLQSRETPSLGEVLVKLGILDQATVDMESARYLALWDVFSGEPVAL